MYKDNVDSDLKRLGANTSDKEVGCFLAKASCEHSVFFFNTRIIELLFYRLNKQDEEIKNAEHAIIFDKSGYEMTLGYLCHIHFHLIIAVSRDVCLGKGDWTRY